MSDLSSASSLIDLDVTYIRKIPDHYDGHHRIEGIGGAGDVPGGWYHTEGEAIRNIEAGTYDYWVMAAGTRMRVIVSMSALLMSKFLTTEPETDPANGLLGLAER